MKKLIKVVIVIIILLGIIFTTKALIEKAFKEEPIHTEDYTVSAGQTLWDIACENTDGNVCEYVYELRKLNNINDCIIYPGQVIKIIK